MPQAEYEVCGPFSKTTISRCASSRLATDAALMPAASPPTTTMRLLCAILRLLMRLKVDEVPMMTLSFGTLCLTRVEEFKSESFLLKPQKKSLAFPREPDTRCITLMEAQRGLSKFQILVRTLRSALWFHRVSSFSSAASRSKASPGMQYRTQGVQSYAARSSEVV